MDIENYIDSLTDIERKHAPKSFFLAGDKSLLFQKRRVGFIPKLGQNSDYAI